eukprot:5536979-Amphidinium_carterae.1
MDRVFGLLNHRAGLKTAKGARNQSLVWLVNFSTTVRLKRSFVVLCEPSPGGVSNDSSQSCRQYWKDSAVNAQRP